MVQTSDFSADVVTTACTSALAAIFLVPFAATNSKTNTYIHTVSKTGYHAASADWLSVSSGMKCDILVNVDVVVSRLSILFLTVRIHRVQLAAWLVNSLVSRPCQLTSVVYLINRTFNVE